MHASLLKGCAPDLHQNVGHAYKKAGAPAPFPLFAFRLVIAELVIAEIEIAE
jgi:hypothetical protein